MVSDSSLHIMHPRPFVVGVFRLLYDALPAGPTLSFRPAWPQGSPLVSTAARFPQKPKTMLSKSAVLRGACVASCAPPAAYLLSMVFFFCCTKSPGVGWL